MATHDIITVVRDPLNGLGKRFSFDANGTPKKGAAVTVCVGEAVQHPVSDVKALKKLLVEVSEDTHSAIINSVFPLIPVGVPFLLLSENEFKKRGIERHDSSIAWPANIPYRNTVCPALGRFKEHAAPSSWLLIDRDVDEHTPKEYAELDYDGWLAMVNKLLPGITQCARLRAHSSSARVSYDGKLVGGGNGHTWVQVADPGDINRLRTAVKARALDLGMTWIKPRYSRTTGEIVGNDVVSIIDWSVFTMGRLVFVGKPEVRNAI